jgi:MFS family permease
MVSSISIFEIGSLVCGLAQNVDQLIAGRVVSGVGAAGMCACILSLLSDLLDRPSIM